MKRINVHFDNAAIEGLDKKREQLQNSGRWYQRGISRADLIRFAVGEVFGVKCSYVHTTQENLRELLEELKPKKKKKG